MSLIEQVFVVVVAALTLKSISAGWNWFKKWKHDEGRIRRREAKKFNRKLRRELLDLGIPKEEL